MLSKFIVTSCLLACCEVGAARRVVSHFTPQSVLESSRQILLAIQQEMPGDEDGKDIENYVAKKMAEKCEQLKQEEKHHPDQADSSAFRNLTEKVKESKLCSEKSENGDTVISSLVEKLKNPAIAKWICTQGFEMAEIKVDESTCDETSELLVGGLQELSSKSSGKSTMERAAMLGVYLVRAAVILIPLPSPLSWILDKATEKLLKQLTKDAEEALDNLEKLLQSLEQKMWDISRKVVAEEFLRVGGAQVKVAEDQVKDIESLEEDDFFRDLMIKSVDSSQKIMDLAQKATSFNRWATIEQSLATSLAILRPPDFMETSDEMAPFIRVMKIHFMIELTVLSHMFKVVESTSGKSFKKMVVAKAHRAALAVFPYLFIIGGDQADQALQEALKSPLLRPDPVENPERNPCKATGHSLVCVWLELLSHSSKRDTQAFKKPQSSCEWETFVGKSPRRTQAFHFGTDGKGEGFGVFIDYVNKTEDTLNLKCSREEQYIAEFQEIHDSSKYWGKDTVEGKCTKLEKGRVKRHLKVTFSGSLCSNKLSYGNVSVGELVSMKFEEETQEMLPCDDPRWEFSRKLKSSTCYISNVYT